MYDPPRIKSRFHYFHLANAILMGNLIAGLAGDHMGTTFFEHRYLVNEPVVPMLKYVYNYITYVAVIFSIAFIRWYEQPIRKCLWGYYRNTPPSPALLARARKRVLNEPYVITFMEALLWMGATLLLWFMGAQSGLGIGIACGLITVVLAFFWMEYINQNHLIPLFFPDNKPSTVRGAFSVGLMGKVTALIFAVAIVPFTFIQLTINRYRVLQSSPHADLADLMAHMTQAITSESITFLITGMGLSWLLVLNLKKPIDEIIRVLEAVKKGDYRERAQIFSTDEIGFAGERLNAMTEGLAERELIKDRFGKYVDRQIRDEILSGRIPLDGEIKEATILFADLRNFTPLVAVSDPKELIHILNAYFNEMAQAIKAHNGLILQFIGDEVEAVFGAPVDNPGHRTDAVRAALEMRTRLAQLNRDFQRRGIPPLAHGVGIHTGPVLAATIGSDDRAAYSLIGDTVNLASRIQELNKRFKTDILVSSEMADQIHTIARLVPMPRVTVKGKENPIGVFSVESTHFH